MDPNTLQTCEIPNQVFWREPFTTLADVTELKEYFILDVNPTGQQHGRYSLADVEVMRTSDNQQFTIRTHLGSLLHPGDDALGYHLVNSNFNNDGFEALKDSDIPPVILVKKHYPRRKKNKNRNWKLKRIGKDESEMAPRKQDQDRAERDYELFLREIEEDTELRQTLQLYKSTLKTAPKPKPEGMDVDGMEEGEEEEEEEGEDVPAIGMDELLDEFEDMKIDADGDVDM